MRTQNVALQTPLANSPGMPMLQLDRLQDTDVWYRCWRMRPDLRFTYRFLVDVKPSANPQQSARVDPLNPHHMEISLDEIGTQKVEYSIAAMPLAPGESWIIRNLAIPAGTVTQYASGVPFLGNERTIWVYTPPGYIANAQAGYPLLVLFDGFSYQNWIPRPVALDNLTHAGRIPPMVAVLIGNARDSRRSELGNNPALMEFLCKEMLPWVHDHWNVTRDPQKSIVGGYSFGG
jgi:enterochelin esterase-like enzyme